MLLSPELLHREAAERIMAAGVGRDYERKVMAQLTRWAHARGAWIDALERRAKDAAGEDLKRVHRMLDILSGAEDAHIQLDVHFVAVPESLAVRVLGKGLPTVVHASRKTWDDWWKLVRETRGSEVFFKRALTCRDTRPAKIEVLRKTSYVAGYEFDKRTNVLHPVIEQATSGTTMLWTPSVTQDRDFVTLDFHMVVKNLVQPIKQAERVVGGNKVQIQVPETLSVSMRTVVTLPLAGYGAWRFPADAGESELLVFIHVRTSKVKR